MAKPKYEFAANLFLLEGPDCAGKTTLKNDIISLAKEANMECLEFHNGPYPSPTEAAKSYHKQLDQAEKFMSETDNGIVIWDRAHISSLVYGLIIDGEIMDHRAFQELDDRFYFYDTQLIYASPPKEKVLSLWEENIDDELVKQRQQMELIYDFYDYAATSCSILYRVHYDWTNDNLNLNHFKALFVTSKENGQ